MVIIEAKLERVKKELSFSSSGIVNCAQWLRLSLDEYDISEAALKILDNLSESVANCDTKKELKKFVKVKKVLGDDNE